MSCRAYGARSKRCRAVAQWAKLLRLAAIRPLKLASLAFQIGEFGRLIVFAGVHQRLDSLFMSHFVRRSKNEAVRRSTSSFLSRWGTWPQ